MTEDKKKHVGVEGSRKVDWIIILPESLLSKILINLPTKDVVKTSVLSKRWRNLWRYVPALDLDEFNFPDYQTFVSFVDSFLGFNNESHLESFKLKYHGCYVNGNPPESCFVTRWIKTVVDRKVKHLHVWCGENIDKEIQMPPNLFTCESLVSLKLTGVVNFGSPKLISLPSLKVMDLTIVHFENDLELETLISRCPVLESLFIERGFADFLEVLRVCSQSLLSFTHVSNRTLNYRGTDDLVVIIDAPRLRYLRLGDHVIASFILHNMSSLVEADIDAVFNWWSHERKLENDLQKRKMIGCFLEGISCVKDMTISSKTLEVIYHYSKYEQLPLFRSLSFLRVRFAKYRWEMLPLFLESCPNLKSLVVASTDFPQRAGIRTFLLGPRCLLSSVEYVDIERPVKGEAMEMKLLRYFLENSAILKKLTVCLDASMETQRRSVILRELITSARLSSSCQVVVL